MHENTRFVSTPDTSGSRIGQALLMALLALPVLVVLIIERNTPSHEL